MSKSFSYPNKGTCSKETHIVLNDDHTIESIEVIGGCNGNLKGISRLLAKSLKNIIAFGPEMPGIDYRIHSAAEQTVGDADTSNALGGFIAFVSAQYIG